MKWNILLLGMSDDNTLNNILNTLITCNWELLWANSLNHVTEIPIEIGTRMYEFTVVNSSIVHIMIQLLLTCGHKNIYLHEVNIVHNNYIYMG